MQYSLFSKRPLFDDAILARRRDEWAAEPLLGFEARISASRNFWRGLSVTKGRRKETALEQEFNRAVFVEMLGYRLYPGVDGAWTAWPKPATDVTGLTGEPDLLLGNFNNIGSFEALAVVELKRPRTSFDSPQPSYENRTAVEQAFDYAKRLPTCRWVIVSNMEILRLYAIESSDEYHEIDLEPMALGQNENYRDLYRLIGFDYLIGGGVDSPTSRLLAAARDEQASFREGFYKIYTEIREILLEAINRYFGDEYDRNTKILGVQRLLDRLLFIYFCEDHPDGLLRNGLVKEITELALRLPGSSTTKAYEQLKALFRELDVGVQTPFRQMPKYNGELFKFHPIIDQLAIDDELSTRRFVWTSPSQGRRIVEGIYGLHVFDFWREFDRDLLGNLFERSVGDLTALAHGGRPDARKAFGIFYTASRLARFVASSAVDAMLDKDTQLKGAITRASANQFTDPNELIDEIVTRLCQYRIADLACGSGIFLTAALDSLLSPYKKVLEAIAVGLNRQLLGFRQSEVLKASIFGVDLLPQAVELAKLALWLTAARRNEPSADLSGNFVVGDALIPHTIDDLLKRSRGQFDLILGNPPWGGTFDSQHGARVLGDLGLFSAGQVDSWEVFLALVISSLKPGGRFAILVPDTIFSVDKRRTREWLVSRCKLEKVYSLGPDWFTADVRMSTVVLQGTTELCEPDHAISTLVLAGQNRRDAQSGYRPLSQLEVSLQQELQQQRCERDPERQIQVLASDWEIELVSRIKERSVELDSISDHARGDEVNTIGLLWRCGNCMGYTVPGEKEKGGTYQQKLCPNCNATLTSQNVLFETLISDTRRGPYNTPYVDGRGLVQRYGNPDRRYLRLDLRPLFPTAIIKPSPIFRGPKIVLRQAGVGIVATLVEDDCHCPQSIYIYRVMQQAEKEGYSNEFLLACLCSRVMTFIVMKRFGEVDTARAFAKLTHARISTLPIPRLQNQDQLNRAKEISTLVKEILKDQNLGDAADQKIEFMLRELWGIAPDEGRYINGFFSSLEGQAVRSLFPGGAPPAVPPPRQNFRNNSALRTTAARHSGARDAGASI